MRRVTARSGMITVAAAATLGLVLTGCGAGLDAATATQRPSVPGVNVSAEDGSLLVRNAVIGFSEEGYRAGENAPVQLVIFNQESSPVRLVGATSSDAESVSLGDAEVVEPEFGTDESDPDGAAQEGEETPEGEAQEGEETPEGEAQEGEETPEGEAQEGEEAPGTEGGQTDPALPEQTPAGPAEIELPGAGYAQVTLQLVGLAVDVDGVTVVPVELEFDNGVRLTLNLSMSTPLEPVDREGPVEIEAEDVD